MNKLTGSDPLPGGLLRARRFYMNKAMKIALAVIAVVGAAVAGLIYMNWNTFVPIAAMGINYVRYLNAPKGELTVETAQGFDGAPAASNSRTPTKDDGDWPSYNKTLTSDRFSALNEINRENAGRLQVLCTYDTGIYTGFNTGILAVNGALLFSTQYDTFSLSLIHI